MSTPARGETILLAALAVLALSACLSVLHGQERGAGTDADGGGGPAGGETAPGDDEDLGDRLRRLEREVEELRKQLEKGLDQKTLEKRLDAKIENEIEKGFSRGVLTVGGAQLRLGGKIEINLVDAQSFSDPVRGSIENPDPHLIFDRIRLEPAIDVGKKLEVRGQIDFLPQDGETVLKEGAFVWDFRADDYWKRLWWLRSIMQIGLDDRFIHVGPRARVSEIYPLIGTAFWRDEEIALMWEGRIGRKRGAPQKRKRKRGKRRVEDEELERVPRKELTSSTTYEPFDFAGNPGALRLLFSIGDGYTLAGKSIAKDGAALQRIIQDDRETAGSPSLRSLGFGAGYDRDFNWLGEIETLVFYYEDELSDDSIGFLQDELTIRDGAGNPISGYGDSRRDFARRIGARISYHLEAYHLLERWIDTWPGDGLYVRAEYIDAADGALDRDGWYVQGSYRFSFPRPLVADRYFRYVEPVVRYGELNVRQRNDPSLPFTWDRTQLLFGAVLSVTDYLFFKAEYVHLGESTGGGRVDNDELLIQLLLEF